MAYNDFFGDIDNCLGVAPVGVLRNTVAAGVDPVVVYAVGAIQVSITIFDALVIPTAAVALGTFTVETNLAAAGWVALTDAMVCAVVGVSVRPILMTTTGTAQNVIGPADSLRVNKNAAADAGILHLFFHLT
jgi:hypothetical protein